MIPPRGCAFVCMNRRKDAAKAVEKMKGLKINGSAIKVKQRVQSYEQRVINFSPLVHQLLQMFFLYETLA